jgi:hypothetical protein
MRREQYEEIEKSFKSKSYSNFLSRTQVKIRDTASYRLCQLPNQSAHTDASLNFFFSFFHPASPRYSAHAALKKEWAGHSFPVYKTGKPFINQIDLICN